MRMFNDIPSGRLRLQWQPRRRPGRLRWRLFTADADNDGICDDVDDCVGSLDACGVCNGPGAVYDCGCTDIPAGDCDCDGNQEDAIGDCGGDLRSRCRRRRHL